MVIHPLKKWLKSEGRLVGWAASRLSVSSTAVSRWFMGMREMRLELRLAVETLTEGQVTRTQIEDWQAQNLKRLKPNKAAA